MLEREIETIARGICTAFGASMDFRYERRYPALVNSEQESLLAAAVAAKVVGKENVNSNAAPKMGSEDFAYMLQESPGCYIWLGNGAEGELGGCSIHNPYYDFNDEIAVLGASYWAELVETALPLKG